MEEAVRLDEVTAFGGKLNFLIPHDWEEQKSVADAFCLRAKMESLSLFL
jgi:hypothetical protein